MERTLDNIVKNNLNNDQIKEFNKIYYGREDNCEIKLKQETREIARNEDIDVTGFSFAAAKEETRKQRTVKVGLVQHSIVLTTDRPIKDQRQAIFDKVEMIINLAASEEVQIICLQETWSMPFFLCTKEKERWSEFAESSTNGPSVTFLSELARQHDMVIISPILEVDEGTWWNTAVVIDADGEVMGKYRKNHLPSVGSFTELPYYAPGDKGHAVFETKYAKIAISICYDRHHALNWLMFGLNGAEIVFNPAATTSEFGEAFWGIEARNAAIANGYFTCSINRVGTEVFCLEEDGKKVTKSYYGSSYVTAPNGCRTPSLSRDRDGLLISELDLNLNRQVRDQWGFQMTARLDMYATAIKEAVVTTEYKAFY